MSSFMQKLRGTGVVRDDSADVAAPATPGEAKKEGKPAIVPAAKSDFPSGATQLPVDIYQVDHEIVIFAQVPGSDIGQFNVSIEGDHDTIVIQGQCLRPEGDLRAKAASEEEHKKNFIVSECNWGSFYRQIILPHEIDPEKAKAVLKDGTLTVRMPLLSGNGAKIQMKIEKADGSAPPPAAPVPSPVDLSAPAGTNI